MEKNNKNPVVNWWNNLKNTKKNYQKVKSSPYASLVFALKVRKMILIPLILFIIWKGYDTIRSYNVDGVMGVVGKIIMLAVFIYLVWRIYRTIPAAKKQIEYYRKYPHVINYCPTNVKEDVDDILNKIKQNQIQEIERRNQNVPKKTKDSGKTKSSSNTTRD
ncbi:MAG: hypothetical protein PHS54_01295 [Clostridia bacterium]|nr:hypothetical protein [Clostridia bacterium]